jgi:hypothetical protein
MNPDKEDPNNHVPAVTPHDDWDDLDVEIGFDSQLPPRRDNATKIFKKELNLSGLKVIEPVDLSKTATPLDAEVVSKVMQLENANPKSITNSAKEEFKSALALASADSGYKVKPVIQNPVMKNRFNVGERDDWGVAQKYSSPRWMIYTALVIIMLVALTVSFSYLNRKDSREESGKSLFNQPVADPVNLDKEFAESALARLSNSQPEAMEILAKYVNAKSISEINNLMYLSDRNISLISNHWKPSEAKEEWKPDDKSSWEIYQHEAIVFGEFKGVNHDFTKFITTFRYENDNLKIDWKATTGYGSANFEELKKGQGDGSEIRGWMESSNFYTDELPEDRYHSFICRSPNKNISIWIYTEIGSDIDHECVQLFSVSAITGEFKKETKVILMLDRGKESILPQQWIIKDLIAENWLDQTQP